MASRRKSKPTQRKIIEKEVTSVLNFLLERARRKNGQVDADHDLLTCGDCQREFVLSDIVQFVQHKVNRCNCVKDKCSSYCDDDFDEADAISAVISNNHTSISAPIARKESDCRDRTAKSHEDISDRTDKQLTIDIAVNTDQLEHSNYSEPFNYVCHTCKSIYKTAWFLVQHVQSVHGVKVYSDHSVDPEVYETGSTPSQPASKRHHSIASIMSGKTSDEERHSQSTSSASSSTSSSLPPVTSSVDDLASSMQPPPSFPFSRAPIPTSAAAACMAAFPHFPRPPMAPGDLSMVNSELLADMPFRRLPPFLPPGLEHALPPGFPFRASPLPDRNALDVYSQRLKRLAFNPAAHSPSSSSSHPPSSPARRPYSAHSRDSSFSVTPPVQDNVPEAASSSPEKPLLPPKTKPCEFCGKCFRFHSNLIVHRRVHTGEKPYRCPLCSHTCGQASKLKRHMKVHIQSQLAAAGITLSLGGGGDGEEEEEKNEEACSDDDLDELEEEEAAAKEAQAEAELRQFADQVKQHQIERQQLKEKGVKEEPVDLANTSSASSDPDKEDKEELSNEQKLAVLNEVMADSGLANIEQYHQAYTQAVAESSRNEDEYPRPPASTGSVDSSPSTASDQEARENGLASSAPSTPLSGKIMRDNSPSPPPPKRVKAEPAEGTAVMTSSNPFLHEYQRTDAIYPSGLWFPPAGMPRDLFASFRNEAVLPHQISLDHHDEQRSALKMSPKTGHPAMHAVSPSLGHHHHRTSPQMTGGVPLRKRNDTCEFCGKVFKNCSNLTVHRRSHTGEKPYKCALCSYACAQSSKLTRHMKTHGRLGKDVYRCKFCNMPFSVASTLEKHMRKCVENQRPAPMDMMMSMRADHSSPPRAPIGSPAVSASTY